ncbi:procollagen C-endopeptidase enhancer 2-like isoform X3 [Gouania willdenowi]|uniref:procollagen C-endopeptidase enhancer 2-like isoform X3 n=1 Tax=Gouania willdenowi TaxID=441366 RepID=UPI001056152D|nr:procollagen C-endopeptidase enhancer 2-like isoform X3 [Gouania willdenowi]
MCSGLFDNGLMSSLCPLLREFLSRVRVVVGEFVQDKEEQVIPIKFVSVHENYTHAVPMNYDIALVELDQHIVMAEQQQGRTSLGLCSVNDGCVSDEEGVIKNPAVPGNRYENNQLCSWHLTTPPGFRIDLEFGSFDLENDSHCHHDRLTVFVGTRKPVAILCGSSVLSPVLLNNSQNAELLFSSDISRAGSGFVIRHHAVRGHFHPVRMWGSHPGEGSVFYPHPKLPTTLQQCLCHPCATATCGEAGLC